MHNPAALQVAQFATVQDEHTLFTPGFCPVGQVVAHNPLLITKTPLHFVQVVVAGVLAVFI